MTDEVRNQHGDDNDDEPTDPEVRYRTGPLDEPEEAPEVIGPPDNPDAPEVEF